MLRLRAVSRLFRGQAWPAAAPNRSHLRDCSARARLSPAIAGLEEAVRVRRRWRVDAPGQGSVRKMAAAVTFCRLLCRSGGAAALSLPPGARCFGVRTSPTGEKVTHTGQVTAAARGASEWAEPRPGPRLSPAHGPPGAPGPRTPLGPCSRLAALADSPPGPRTVVAQKRRLSPARGPRSAGRGLSCWRHTNPGGGKRVARSPRRRRAGR